MSTEADETIGTPSSEWIERQLGAALIELYQAQREEGRASLLGFFHLLTPSPTTTIDFRISSLGHLSLTIETPSDLSLS